METDTYLEYLDLNVWMILRGLKDGKIKQDFEIWETLNIEPWEGWSDQTKQTAVELSNRGLIEIEIERGTTSTFYKITNKGKLVISA